jgi:hypothetical protein
MEYKASAGSASQSIFPTYQQFSKFAKNTMSGVKKYLGSSHTQMTQDGVAARLKQRLAQNTNGIRDSSEIKYFMSGDPSQPTHWLTMVRMTLADEFKTMQTASQQVPVNITIAQSCDRRSCLGCKSVALQGMCYAAQQCMVVNCIGTVINQVKPLCNLGLTLQSYSNEMLTLTLGGWMVFTESYSSILEISLQTSQKQMSIEWVDDAFFGFICSAKDKGGQIAALLTSSIGAKLISKDRSVDMNGDRTTLIDTRLSAKNTILLNGINSFLYQVCTIVL